MALQSARMAGLDVPKETLDRISAYLDKVTPDGSLYAYQITHQPDHVMTAEALLCRQYLGWNQYDPKLVAGVEYLGSHLPNWFDRDVYYWYYGTQVMHHMGVRIGSAGTMRSATCWSSIRKRADPTREAGTRRVRAPTPGPCATKAADYT